MSYENPEALVTTDWLADHLDAPDVCIVDASWHMPNANRNARAEFDETRIPGAVYFDIGDTVLDKEHITAELNRLIGEDHPVGHRWIDDAELDDNPELVRTMSVQPPRGSGRIRLLEIPGVDLQPCGGTHVARTGEIGPVAVAKIENKGRRNRRVSVVFSDV